jgi:hypothetical protein
LSPHEELEPKESKKEHDHSLTWDRVSKARVQAGPEAGTFRLDGSWDPNATERSSCYRYVQDLIDHRRNGASPADIALIVEHGPFPIILGSSREVWRKLPHGACWPLALEQAATSAAATVGRMRALLRQPEPPADCDCGWCASFKDDAAVASADPVIAFVDSLLEP